MMSRVCRIRLISQDNDFRNLFLAKMFKIYGSKSNNPPEGLSIDHLSESQFCQVIASKFSKQQLSTWKIQIQGYEFSFQCDTDKDPPSTQSTTLLLEINQEISDSTIDLLKNYNLEDLNLLIIIDKPSEKIKEKTIKSYKDKIVTYLKSANIKAQQDYIFTICLKEDSSITQGRLKQKLIQIAQKAKENQRSKMEGLKLQKELSRIYKQQTGQFESSIKKNDLRQKVENALRPLLNKYQLKIEKPEQCLKQLLEGNIDEAIIMAQKNERKGFKTLLKQCREYQIFLNSKSQIKQKKQDPMTPIKNMVVSALSKIAVRYKITYTEKCFAEIFNNNFEEAAEYVKSIYKEQFLKDLSECKELSDYFNIYIPTSAQKAALDLLKNYKIADKKEYLKDLLEGKLKQVLQQIPNKYKPNFTKDFQNSEAIQKYLSFRIIFQKNNLKQEAQKAIQIILNKYKVKYIQTSIEEILNHNLDDAIPRVTKGDKHSFQKEIQNCPKLIQFYNSQNNLNERELLKKQAQLQMTELLKKYQVADLDIDQILLDLMNGDIKKVITELPLRKQQNFKKDYAVCQKIKDYLQFVNKSQNQDLQALKKRAIQKISSIAKKYGMKDLQSYLKDLFQIGIEASALYVSKSRKKEYINEVNACKELKILLKSLKESQKEEKAAQPNARQKAIIAIRQLLTTFDIKQPQQCLEELMQNNFNNALFQIKNLEKAKFQKQLLQCKQYQTFLNSSKEVDYQQIAKQSLRKICQEFKVQKKDQCVKQIIQGKLEDAILNVKRANRQMFQKRFTQCEQYQQFLTSKKSLSSQKLIELAKKSLIPILQKFKVKDIEKCLMEIFKKDFQSVIMNVKRTDRQIFLSQIKSCAQYQKYQDSIIIKDESTTIKEKAEKSLRQILKKYDVVEAEDCLQLILNNDVQGALLQIKSQKKQQFRIQLESLKQYKRYLESTGGNHKVKSNIKIILTKKGIKQNLHTPIIDDIIEGKFTQLKNAVKPEQYYLIVSQITQNAQFIAFYTQNEQIFIGNISYFYYSNKSISEL